ncbi:hypothetical protein EUU23_10430 [Sphingorhabdus sp. IMCC26285]|uniref:Uncharacterized protein n=1 Tax=Sphingorhabdus profundilacus TaxID=2509718 RepID=A0A6I4M620_9SPHN|nr:hypothetical protein [Sphingorhabdus profundilacus]MVZ98108.1 hypothetical protein [Sphingorhabdus profundilacus]
MSIIRPMEALTALVPLVLVLRGSIMGAVASASAPGSPHPTAPAQIMIEKANATVKIVTPVAMRLQLLTSDRNGEVSMNEYRLFVRRRLNSGHPPAAQFIQWQLIVDLP